MSVCDGKASGPIWGSDGALGYWHVVCSGGTDLSHSDTKAQFQQSNMYNCWFYFTSLLTYSSIHLSSPLSPYVQLTPQNKNGSLVSDLLCASWLTTSVDSPRSRWHFFFRGEPNESSKSKWHKSCRKAAHPSRRTSGRDRLRAIISEAMRLNWLILNISFIFSWFSLGITTGFPPSPGPSLGLVKASVVHAHKET